MMFKIKAKFIGKDSLGFINGRIYEIKLISSPGFVPNIKIMTECIKPRLQCEYGSWEKFIPNWEVLNYENISRSESNVDTKVNNGLKQSVRDSKINCYHDWRRT